MTIPHHEKDKPTFREISKEALLFLLRPLVRWLSVMRVRPDTLTVIGWTLALCAAALCPSTHPLRQTVERQLRGRQREDGGFGAPVLTATNYIGQAGEMGFMLLVTVAMRKFGVKWSLVAGLTAIRWLFVIPAAPILSVVVIALCVMVIYGLAKYTEQLEGA